MLNTSETIKDLEIIEGRRLLHDFYHDRRVKNSFELRTLFDCWRLCRKGTEVQFGDGRRVRFETYLGWKLGTRVFVEEILSRYYFNFIQGLVYLGALIVLITLALYLAGQTVWFAYAGFMVEALFLLLLAVVTAYSPNDDLHASPHGLNLPETLLSSINTSIHEMTNAVSDLFRLISQTDIRQDVLLTRLTESISKMNAESSHSFAEKLDQTNGILKEYAEISRARLDSILHSQREAVEKAAQLLEAMERGREGGSPV